jgi:hypothetical protein
MDQQWSSPEGSPMMSPPSSGEPMAEERATKWPTVIGIIGIILASLGLICTCPGFFSLQLQRWGNDMAAQSGQANPVGEAQLKAAEQFHIFTLGLLAVGLFVTLWLLIGSISLLRRRRAARTHMIGWAMASLLTMALNVALQIVLFQSASAELTRMGEGHLAAQLWIGVVIGAVFGILFGVALQTFVLIWFSRRKIVEEVATWR